MRRVLLQGAAGRRVLQLQGAASQSRCFGGFAQRAASQRLRQRKIAASKLPEHSVVRIILAALPGGMARYWNEHL